MAFTDVDLVVANGCEKNLKDTFHGKRSSHFRKVLDKMGKVVEAVSVVTPQHTRFIATC